MTYLDNDDFIAFLILFVQQVIVKIKLLIKITQVIYLKLPFHLTSKEIHKYWQG